MEDVTFDSARSAYLDPNQNEGLSFAHFVIASERHSSYLSHGKEPGKALGHPGKLTYFKIKGVNMRCIQKSLTAIAMVIAILVASSAFANDSDQEEQEYLNTLTKETCKEFELLRKTVRGKYLGYQEGDFGWCTIKQDNGKDITFNCDEEEAIKAFGKEGSYVEAVIKREQFWNDYPALDCCWRATIMVSGKKINKK